MTRAACAFKEADVKRAVRAVVAAGQPVRGVRFDKDGFTVVVGEPEQQLAEESANSWDEVIKR
jgi:ABC-type Zn2+ transport system substrate-binding protein/surface adhesin